MTLFLIIGCNNGGGEIERRNEFLSSIANLGKGFLDVFVTFGDMVADAFGIKAETKKGDVGKYFTDIETTITSVKNKLNTVVAKNGNYPKVKTAVDEFIAILGKIEEGAKEAAKGATGDVIIGNTVKNGDAVPGEATSVKAIVKGIKAIVGVVLKEGKADADATKDDSKKDIGKLFTATTDANRADNAAAQAASASIGAVSGADILQAITKSKENPNADGTEGIEKAEDAAEIAVAPAKDNKKEIKDGAKKDAIIAAGIALRAMAKNGKFSIKNNEDEAVTTINSAAASAVNKTLSALIIAIRNTVDSGLKKINAALATVKQEDKTEEATNTVGSTASQ
ncbi:variable large family protein [Borrelia miyamotoi]|uniref:Variable large protein n=1 Tax=Borrelia miyamotoi TaxID=47466 RepID=A0AAQ2WYR5_9SPIR|nr:variable large family protein [Borrelia miyamotoi]AOW96262.1 Variable large protein 15/16 [Borrelia miyamotoi]QTL84346.1 variable large family protein [Borrelia miyamotoi]WAZ86018.1 variable large family protein [Borrelia miyamotoi]WAZ91801.1 variable large family protein [Borrelia miyamotoi]WAZ93094.1 variable large family protein [Borrelia miyamotoi]